MGIVQLRIKNARRITELGGKIETVKSMDYSKQSIDKAYDYAMNIMPRDTGALRNALQKVYQKNRGRLRLVQPRNNKDKNRVNSARTRPYHMWFHGIKTPTSDGKGYDLRRGKYAPKSGISNFMDKTREYMQNQTTESIDKQIKQLFK